ncbi:hypothetical protein [Acidisoma sp. C75]
MPYVTLFGFYNCQSIIQLAAGINLALTVGAALRAPRVAAFKDACERALDSLEWHNDLLVSPRQSPIDERKLREAVSVVEVAEETIRRGRSDIEKAAEKWKRSDSVNFGMAVFMGLVAIALLFLATEPSQELDVSLNHLASLMRLDHAIRQVTLSCCAVLYLPLIKSLLGFVNESRILRGVEKEFWVEVVAAKEAAREALRQPMPKRDGDLNTA